MDKYYTPNIEEFHVGFEYESKDEYEKWVSRTFPEEGLCTGTVSEPELVEMYYNLLKEDARVRKLDHEDIESLGWDKIKGVSVDSSDYEIKSFPAYAQWTLRFYKPYLRIRFYHPDDSKGEMHFFGIVKNKSELKRIMQQLNILK